MECIKLCEDNYSAFHELATAYYREGEDLLMDLHKNFGRAPDMLKTGK